jgi:hypothetical protein
LASFVPSPDTISRRSSHPLERLKGCKIQSRENSHYHFLSLPASHMLSCSRNNYPWPLRIQSPNAKTQFLKKSLLLTTPVKEGRKRKPFVTKWKKKKKSFTRSLPRASREEPNASYLEDSAPLTSRRKLGDCPLLLLASTSRLLCFPSSIWVKIFLFWLRDCSQICTFLSIPHSRLPSLPLLCPCKPSHVERARANEQWNTNPYSPSKLPATLIQS